MSESRPVFFELGTEELPPLSVEVFWESLWQAAHNRLYAAGLLEEVKDISDAELGRLFTARRLALSFSNVRSETPPQVETRRGPAFKSAFDEQGQPTKALLGFARSCGAEKQQVERWRAGEDCLKTDKGTWVIFEKMNPARRARDVLPEIMRQAVADVPLDVHMRWGSTDDEFARPVRWVVLLYGDEVVSGELMGLKFGQESQGHRFLSSGSIDILRETEAPTADIAENYRRLLHKNGVRVSLGERRRVLIDEQIPGIEQRLHQECGVEVAVVRREEVWKRALSSAEWPQAVVGRFDERFLKLPDVVVETVLEDQQQCFPVEKWDGGRKLVPYFVAVANLPDKSGRIRIGCERVVQARLQDAEFYLKQDQQRSLGDRVADLERVVFHRKLGTMADRSRRIEKLALWIADKVDADRDMTRRAAMLCKADLGTDMVQSFPNLQGVMGEYYARLNEEDEDVCQAIREHYHWPPKEPDRDQNPVSLALASADRLDMLFGVFAAGEVPTGTRDPLGVRRAASELLKILWDRRDLDMQELIEQAAAGYLKFKNVKTVVPAVSVYITDRLRGVAISNNHPKDEIEAALAVGWHNPPEMFARLNALHSFRQNIAGAALNLSEANKRIRNILRKTEAPAGKPDPQFLREPAEQALDKRISKLRPDVQELCRRKEFQAYYEALERLATLAEPVAQFFDDVLVMAEEPELRHNRLRLLRDVRALFMTIADLSRLQGAAKEA